ncbi:MAG: PAS domain S-box protein [Smithellaceae bacterium]
MKSPTDREISCRVTKTLLLYVRKNNNGFLGPLLDGLELDEKYLLDTDNWVSHAFLHVLYERMIRILRDENAVYNMALASDRMKSLDMLDRIARLLGSPHLIYSHSPTYNKLLKLNGDVHIHEISNFRVLLEDRYHVSREKTRHDCDYTRGILAGIPTIFGMPPARVEEIECQVLPELYGHRTWPDSPIQGANGCLYRVSWDSENRIPFWRRLLKYGVYLKAIKDLRDANRKIQGKYNEVRELASNLQKTNQELEQARKQQDISLRQLGVSESRYRLLAENISDVIWTMSLDDMRFTYVSPSVEKFLGYTPQEFLMLSVEQILVPEALKEIMDVLAEELNKEKLNNVDTNRSRTMTVKQICKDRGHIWGEVTAAFLRDDSGSPIGFLGVTRNINERMQAQERLCESEARLNMILEFNPTAIILVKKKTRKITYANNSARQAVGLPSEDILGRVCHRFVCPAELNTCPICDLGQSINRSERFLLRSDGSLIPILKTVVIINIAGEEYLLESFIDISEPKKAEEEKHLLQERLQRAEKMEALGTLAGGVAHDLNNVLGVVVGYSELLLSEIEESSKIRQRVLNIMQGGDRAAAIVQDLLTMARRGVHAGTVININDSIIDFEKSPEFLKLSSLYPDVQIQTSLVPDLLNIMGSPVHLSKTLYNLVSNAVEAMPGMGGRVTIKTNNQYLDRPVQGYDDVSEGDYVVLSVSDTGEGISAADLKHIFEPFYTKKVMGRSGTGLGLSVVWGTIKDHQGYVDVQSAEGEGTTFTLYFPVTRQEISKDHISISLSEYMGNSETVLIVDDIKEQRKLAVEMLRKLNYQTASVSCGEEAVEYLTTGKADIIVLDMIMEPGMDGLDTYRKILEINPQQKAVIVSGFSETDRVSQVQKLGAGAYVKKPYVLEKLGIAVRKELDRST